MRLSSVLLVISAGLLSAAAAASEQLAPPPSCGYLCIANSTLHSTCSPTDVHCVCTNVELNAKIEQCVMTSCSVRDQLSTKKYSYETCGRQGQDRSAQVWIIGVVFLALGLAAFLMRCFARIYVGAQAWGLDDWIMCLAVAFMVPINALSIPIAQHGLGKDMWFVDFDDITQVLFLYYFDAIFYITSLGLTKVSILCFYLKVFPRRQLRNWIYGLIAFNVVFIVAYDLALIFQCNPIQGFWRSWDGTFEAQCISLNLLGWTAAGFNIALDLGTIILPLPELFQLSMTTWKKVQIILMFAVGFFVTVVSAIRLRSLVEFATTQNVTQDYTEVGYWSTIEVPVGIICACMPAIRSLFSLVFPKAFGTTEQGTSSDGASGYNNGSRGLHYASKSKRSAKAKQSSQRSQSSQIQIKQEWTVQSGPKDDGASDIELVPYDPRNSGGRGQAGASGVSNPTWEVQRARPAEASRI